MTTDRVGGAVLAAIGSFVIWESLVSARRLPLGSLQTPGPAYMPVVLAAALVFFGVFLVAVGSRAPRLSTIGWHEWRHGVAIIAVCVLAAVLLERAGYRLTMGAVLLILLLVVERRGVIFSVAFAAALAFGSYYVFDTLLRVLLPRGPFGL